MSISSFTKLMRRVFQPAPDHEDAELSFGAKLAAPLTLPVSEYLFAVILRKTLDSSARVQLSDTDAELQFFDRYNSASHLCPLVFERDEILEQNAAYAADGGTSAPYFINDGRFVVIAIRSDATGESRLKRIGDSHYLLQPPLDKTRDMFAVIDAAFDCELFELDFSSDEIEEKLKKCKFQNAQM